MTGKKNWIRVKLGDVVRQVKDKIDTTSCSLEYYLGGEHFNSNDLHVNGKGVIKGSTIGPSFIMRFKPGQVLLVSRNPHLRKVAVADFEGICSNVTYICETKSNKLLQEFLPFVMKSDDFWKFAEENKRGSTNFYLNWSDFERYEFMLPPVEEQKIIAELLWEIDGCCEKYKLTLKKVNETKKIFVDEWLAANSKRMIKFSELWGRTPDSGCSAPEATQNTGHFVLSLSALSQEGYIPDNFKKVVPTDAMLKAKLYIGDLIISRSNTAELVGFVGIYNEAFENVSFPDTMMRLNIDQSKAYKKYIEIMLLSSNYRKCFKTICAGTSSSMKKINRKTLGEIKVPLPKLEDQKKLINRIEEFRETQKSIEKHIKNYEQVSRNYICAYLGGAN